MSMDTIGDFLTVIRNGIRASHASVTVPYSKLKMNIADILKEEGYVRDVMLEEDEKKHKFLKIALKYKGNESVIHEIKRLSRPGLRIYEGSSRLQPVIGGLGIAIVTTNRGVMTNKKAKRLGVGGEVLCTIW
ncbi:MAG TPA: 30S ribosomal protein S8 [Candidatus Babeliaceae bacterium]|nr:30S ribosomal protein S8 [Candidatus Babeliaceae bacterium]